MTTFPETDWIARVERQLGEAQPEGGGLKPIHSVAIKTDSALFVKAKPFTNRGIKAEFARQLWEIAALPHLEFAPAPQQAVAVLAGSFTLWPEQAAARPEAAVTTRERIADASLLARPLPPINRIPVIIERPRPVPVLPIPTRQAFFARNTPRLLSLEVTVESRVEQGGAVRISGGNAVFVVSIYAEEGPNAAERLREEWIAALEQAGVGGKFVWKFLPIALRDLQASVEIPAQHLAGPPQVSVSSADGTATFVVSLSEAGVMLWKTALEQSNGGSIPGVCRLTASYFVQGARQVVARTQELSAALGTLFAGQGPDSLTVINPQQMVVGRLVVSGHDLIQRVVVSTQPNTGQAPADQVFDQSGGQLDVTVTTQDVTALQMDWVARVTFKPSGWPVISESGTLNSADGWATVIKPDSWVSQYTFMALLVDDAGNPVALSEAGDNYHVNGVLTFTAPYIPATGVLVSPFDLANQRPVNVALPRFPGQPFGDLLVNLFVTRGGKAATLTRRLAAAELAVVLKVFPDARLEMITGADALEESSALATVLADLGRLSR